MRITVTYCRLGTVQVLTLVNEAAGQDSGSPSGSHSPPVLSDASVCRGLGMWGGGPRVSPLPHGCCEHLQNIPSKVRTCLRYFWRHVGGSRRRWDPGQKGESSRGWREVIAGSRAHSTAAAGGSGCFPRYGPGRLQVFFSHRAAEEEEGRLPAPS